MARFSLAFVFQTFAIVYASNVQIPLNELSNGPFVDISGMPHLGFGTWNLDKSNASEAVSWAIQTGYRHIDCAAAYGNEFEVGRGIRDGIEKVNITREDLWVTSKLWNDHHGLNSVESGIDQTLQNLGVMYLDLYLMHWPVSSTPIINTRKIEYRDTWGAMSLLIGKGKTRHIGVSNFAPDQLKDLLKNSTTQPSVHQMELHPYLQQNDWLDYHAKKGIHVTAYSPLAGTNPTYDEHAKGSPKPLLNNTVIKKIAKARDCTPAQVVLAWGLSRGTSAIPKSQHKDRIVENFGAQKCKLSPKDVKKIGKLGKAHQRYNNPSKSWSVELYKGLEDSKGKHKINS